MTDLEKNKELVRAILGHIFNFDLKEVAKLVTEDVVWWVNGGTQEGEYFRGKATCMDLISRVGDKLVGRKLGLTILGMIAEGDHVAVEVRSNGMMKSGIPYLNSYHEIYRIRDGLVCLCKEYADTKFSADSGIRPRTPVEA